MIAAVASACILGSTAAVASAYPSQAQRCASSCHAAGAGATVTASLVSTTTTSATYGLTMTGSAGSAWAVFDGSTKVKGATTMTDTFTVDLGKTYDVFAVENASPYNFATTSVSPAAPAVETTVSLDETIPPVTTCDAKGSYMGTATVELTATDGKGRGVAYIYYSIDGARVHLFTVGVLSQTSLSIAAPLVGSAEHTIAFWSQDDAGNVEVRTTKTFTVAASAAAPPAQRTPTSLSLKVNDTTLRVGQYATMSGVLTPAVPAGAHVRYQVRLPGKSSYTILSSTRDVSAAGASSLRYKFATRGTYYVMARYLGSATFDHCDSKYVKVVVR